jgi:tRNA-2-methylthio-N6-dimethylallyladenosine synthase
MKEDKKKILIRTLGCQMNVRDSEVLAGLLQKGGYAPGDDLESSDVVIFNTCAVRQHAEDKVWSEIGRISKIARRKKGTPKPVIGLIGCMAQNYREQAFDRSPDIDFVVGPADLAKIPGILTHLLKYRGQSPKSGDSPLFHTKIWETDGDIRPEEIYHTGHYEDKSHAFVVISEGCNNFCSYCVVPYVRGQVRHRDANNILKEVTGAVTKGITRVTLLGQNVNSYKSPTALKGEPVDFVRLMTIVSTIPELKEVSFITSHPKDTTPALFKAMAESETIRKYLHLPVQAGSDVILKAMNRGYTRQWYLDLVKEYRRLVKGGLLSTDIIVGFPKETKEDFQQTYDLVKDVRFDSAYIFKYSPRPDTAAAQLADSVDKEEKERRHALILQLQKKISLQKHVVK